jgi:hypothetical protein
VKRFLAVLAAFALAGVAPAAGALAPRWSTPGLGPIDVISAAATGDGALVILTSTGLQRLTPAGAPDLSYGTEGTVTLPFTGTWIGADQNDDDVLAIGTVPVGTLPSGTVPVETGYEAARILPSGTLDLTFGDHGIVTLGAFGGYPYLDGDQLLVQSSADPPALERLSASGSLDPTFGGGHPVVLTGQSEPGPLSGQPAPAPGYEVAAPQCPTDQACPFVIDTISSSGAVGGAVAVRGASFAPTQVSPEANGSLLVADTSNEVEVRPDGSLVPTFGAGACGSTIGLPTMAGGGLHVLADGRTADLNSPANLAVYDVAAHVFVRSGGRLDPTFGAGGHAMLPGFVSTRFLTSTDSAMWIDVVTANQTEIDEVLLSPPADPVSYGPSPWYGSRLIGASGQVTTVAPVIGAAPPACGDLTGVALARPVVGGATSPDGVGYWMVASDGGVFTFGDAGFFGSTGALHLNAPIVGMAATPDGGGYWLVASDGGIFSFGDATFYGSTGVMHLNAPIVGMAPTADGRGYWLVASDGGIFSFGDATFYGSTGAMHLNAPIVGMLRTRSGDGDWLAARDGGVFTFGDAGYGGDIHVPTPSPVVGIAAAPPDTFTVAMADGQEVNSDFGSSIPQATPTGPVVGVIGAG